MFPVPDTVHTSWLSQAKDYQMTLIPKNTNSLYPPTPSQKATIPSS